MTPAERALLTDSRLSDAARVIGLYMTEHAEAREYRADELAALLHGLPSAQTVWRHVRQLEVAGYVNCVKGVPGPGHGKWYEPGNPGKISGVRPDSDPSSTENFPGLGCAPPPVTATPPPSNAGVRVDDIHLEKLRRLLGPDAEVLDRFADSAKHPSTWARDIWSAYRPPSGEPADGGGMEWRGRFGGEDEETGVRVLVRALRDYAEKGERYSGYLFRKYVGTALNEVRREAEVALERRATGSDNARPYRGRQEKQAPDQQEYKYVPYDGLRG